MNSLTLHICSSELLAHTKPIRQEPEECKGASIVAFVRGPRIANAAYMLCPAPYAEDISGPRCGHDMVKTSLAR